MRVRLKGLGVLLNRPRSGMVVVSGERLCAGDKAGEVTGLGWGGQGLLCRKLKGHTQ